MDSKINYFYILISIGLIFIFSQIFLFQNSTEKIQSIQEIETQKIIDKTCINLTGKKLTQCESEIQLIIQKINSPNPCFGLENESLKFCELKNQNCESDDCYLTKAQTNLNETYCFKISNESLKVSCSVVIKETKYFELSVKNNDILFCDNLVENRKLDCRDNFYLAQKYNYGDKSFCDKISKEVLKNECLQ